MTMVRKAWESIAFYPVTIMYAAGASAAVAIAADWLTLPAALLSLTMFAVLLILLTVSREVRLVHHLVNSQRDELLERIGVLVDALQDAGVDLPNSEKKKEQQDA